MQIENERERRGRGTRESAVFYPSLKLLLTKKTIYILYNR
jgi:hypothetical protein